MSEFVSPAEVFQRVVQAVEARRQGDILDDCFAEDVVIEHPFMVPEPSTTIGRERLRERVAYLRTLPITMDIDEIVVHKMVDPEVIVGEFRSRVTSRSGDALGTSSPTGCESPAEHCGRESAAFQRGGPRHRPPAAPLRRADRAGGCRGGHQARPGRDEPAPRGDHHQGPAYEGKNDSRGLCTDADQGSSLPPQVGVDMTTLCRSVAAAGR